MTADSIDAAAIHDYLSLPKKDRPGSLKSLEKLIAVKVGAEKARLYMGPLAGAYELRHGDAHLASSEINESFELVRVDPNSPTVIQGRQMLRWCVGSIVTIADIIDGWDQEPNDDEPATSAA